MSIQPKDFNWQDHTYNSAGGAPITNLVAQNSNHIWDYMLTRPKYTDPLVQWQAYHRYNPRLEFGSEQILNSGLFTPGRFDPVGLDAFSKKQDDKNKAIVESVIKFT